MKKKKSAKKKLPTPKLSIRQKKIKERILLLCEGDGLSSSVLRKQMKGIEKKECEECLGLLIQEKRIQVFTTNNGNKKEQHFVALNEKEAEQYSGLGATDVIIFKLIESSENSGVNLRTIKFRSRMQGREISQSIKLLKKKKLIKEIKTVKGRKVFLKHDVVPSSEITGGIWYKDAEFNAQLIEGLQANVVDLIKKSKRVVTVTSCFEVIKRKTKENIKIEDLQRIFDILHNDGFIEKAKNKSGEIGYIISDKHTLFQNNVFTLIPCSVCPVFDQCTDKANVSPVECVYLRKWQKF